MRIRRIAVRDLRGIREREIHLPDTGVVVLEGPNEIGKSSLAEAIDVLFDELHTTTKQYVRDLQPHGRDVGTEIEVDAVTGPYEFTYRKRFNRDREALLTLRAPAMEAVTGRAAHERMEAVLAETLDVDLWRALRVQQGDTILQADLRKSPSLVAALDRAAGSATGGEPEETLFCRVRDEHQRYYTATGRDGAQLRDADDAVEQARAIVERLEADLARIDADVDRVEQLQRRLVDLRRDAARARADADEHARRRDELESLVAAHEQRQAERDAAAQRLENIGTRRAVRAERIAAVTAARGDVAELTADLAALDAAIGPAEEAAEVATRALADARAHRDRAEARVHDLARALDRARDRAELATLRARLAAAEGAAARARAAEDELAASPVDAAALADLRALSARVAEAAAACESAGARVAIAAASDLDLVVDGQALPAAVGTTIERTATGELVVEVPGVITLRVRPAETAGALAEAAATARADLAAALDRLGVDAIEAAEAAFERRLRAEHALAAARDETADDTDELRSRIAAIEQRAVAADADGDESTIRAAQAEAAAAADTARDAADAAERERDERCTARDTLRQRRDRVADELARARDRLARVLSALDADRDACSDDALATAEAEAAAALATAEEELGTAHPEATADLAAAHVLADNAAAALARIDAERHDVEGELRELAAKLEVRGDDGVFEALEDARAALAHAERERDAVRRRAAAAHLLHDTMRSCREAARQAYAGPLRERIASLARIAFGTAVDVDLDDETLAIAAVTRDGVRLPFEALSIGTQEQLAVIGRLACAMLVQPDGGVPVVLDDALGYSDPQRLESMGAVLSVAARSCQVLVLTCLPDRYRHVGAATVVRLAA